MQTDFTAKRVHEQLLPERQTFQYIDRVSIHAASPLSSRVRSHLPTAPPVHQRHDSPTGAALCLRPDLVVFDEPSTALDMTTQFEVLKAIRDAIARSGAAALYISHDLAVSPKSRMRFWCSGTKNPLNMGLSRALSKSQHGITLLWLSQPAGWKSEWHRPGTLVCNPKRRHSTPGYLSPNDFENKVGLA